MAINLENENLITLADAARMLPRIGGRKVAVSTLWRWALRGLGGTHLEHLRVGRSIVTSREALQRFFAAQADRDLDPVANQIPQPSRRRRSSAPISRHRQRELAHADAILAEAGI